jgi:hypothetical protein
MKKPLINARASKSKPQAITNCEKPSPAFLNTPMHHLTKGSKKTLSEGMATGFIARCTSSTTNPVICGASMPK